MSEESLVKKPTSRTQREQVRTADQWERVAQRYQGPLRGFFAKRVEESEDVDDLVQEVFVRLMRRIHGKPIERVEQYLFQTAANVLRDRGRRNVQLQDTESFDVEEHEETTDISPERVLVGRESVAQVISALNDLSERTRDVFVLRALEEHKYAEISRILRISTRSAEKHMAKALAHLGRVLDRPE